MRRIFAHHDLDGVFSAALVSIAEDIDKVIFCGASEGADRYKVTENDAIVDMKYTKHAGLWFDHHKSHKKLNVKGKFALEDSCAQVVYDYYKGKVKFPKFMVKEIKDVNKVDMFKFTLNDFKKKIPALGIMRSTAIDENEFSRKKFLRKLFKDVKVKSFKDLIKVDYVKKRILENIEDNKKILEAASKGEVYDGMLIFKTNVRGSYVDLYPARKEVEVVVMLKKDGDRYNVFAGRNTMNKNKEIVRKKCDLGKIMEHFEFGGGHKEAAGCRIKKKDYDSFVKYVVKKWKEQRFS